MARRPRVLYLARTAPSQLSGATLAMRRHFIDHNDLDVLVVTNELFDDSHCASIHLQSSPLCQRLKNTRFIRFLQNAEILAHSRWLPSSLIAASQQFRPDLIFTVADLTLSETARLLANRLSLPLVVNFQDWWPRGQFYYSHEIPYQFLVPYLERRFRRLYQQSDLAFCTSEGMRDYLGSHPNSHVLYPIGDGSQSAQSCYTRILQPARKSQLVYTGTAFGSYGQMLLCLADALSDHPSWELVIYGKEPDWPCAVLSLAKQTGLYRGFLPFEQLRTVLASADACLSVMSFEPDLEVMMRTSFTTKVLDYCSAGSPVIMWGPSFCSPIRLIQKHQAGLTITSPDASAVLDSLQRLDREPGLHNQLADSAKRLANTELAHFNIHALFMREISRVIARS